MNSLTHTIYYTIQFIQKYNKYGTISNTRYMRKSRNE